MIDTRDQEGFACASGGHLYIHIPLCRSRCRYCDFPSHTSLDQAAYVAALLREADHLPDQAWSTLYIGGGSPSALDPVHLDHLLAGLGQRLRLSPAYEWTCEANPADIDEAMLHLLRTHGINRLSLGVQSLDDGLLTLLGRRHNAARARTAITLARAIMPRLNVDLMLALPGQEAASVAQDVDMLADQGIDHLSAYALIIEDGTPLADDVAQGRVVIPDDEASGQSLEAAWTAIERHWPAYETSSFAHAHDRCRHNLACWRLHDYHALGAAAVSTVAGQRHSRPSDPSTYIAALAGSGPPQWPVEIIDPATRLREAWMLGLRLRRGVHREHLTSLGDNHQRIEQHLAPLVDSGLVMTDGPWIALAPPGRLLQDAITRALMP